MPYDPKIFSNAGIKKVIMMTSTSFETIIRDSIMQLSKNGFTLIPRNSSNNPPYRIYFSMSKYRINLLPMSLTVTVNFLSSEVYFQKRSLQYESNYPTFFCVCKHLLLPTVNIIPFIIKCNV